MEADGLILRTGRAISSSYTTLGLRMEYELLSYFCHISLSCVSISYVIEFNISSQIRCLLLAWVE